MRELTAAAQENAKAMNAAQLFELDDVIDPAETRRAIASTLSPRASRCPAAAPSTPGSQRRAPYTRASPCGFSHTLRRPI